MTHQYSQGMHEIASGSWAWLQPDGGWCWTNAGLITDGGQSLLVDTLIDRKTTSHMLDKMRKITPAAHKIDILVNSHADADHTFGNQLVPGARIIASQATADEFFKLEPEKLRELIANAGALGEGARYLAEWMGPDRFDFSGISLTPPTETFEDELTLSVGAKSVHLINVGPAHTSGDTLVHVPADRIVFTGDILFNGVHPAIWDGSIDGWLAACDRILAMDVDIVVPGHGALTDKAGVELFKSYITSIRLAARARFEAGLTVEDAAADIIFEAPFEDWLFPERVAGAVNFLFREWGAPDAKEGIFETFDLIARYASRRKVACAEGRHLPSCRH